MPISRGRPRMTPEAYSERLQAYCARYRVAPRETGLPPFPSGQRETPQHKEWISLYKAHQRLGRLGASAEERSALIKAQDGRCPICGEPVDASASVHETGRTRSIVHPRCHQLAGLAEPLGPAGLDRLRTYLWPSPAPKKKTSR